MLEVKLKKRLHEIFECSFLINFDVFTSIIGFEAYSPNVKAKYEFDVSSCSICRIDRFHMTSRRPYLCTKKILWELNSFHMLKLSFIPSNLQSCWPRDWKRSIGIAIVWKSTNSRSVTIAYVRRFLLHCRAWSGTDTHLYPPLSATYCHVLHWHNLPSVGLQNTVHTLSQCVSGTFRVRHSYNT